MPKRNNTQIYDKMFKKILTLSGKAVINFINGLFGTDYPTGLSVSYNWTEFHDDSLKKTLADTIITIDGRHCYHIEAQTYKDGAIVFRIFEYGYRHAERHKTADSGGGVNRLVFPEPKVLYIYADGEIPDRHELILDFGAQGSFTYHVSTLQLNRIPIEELNQRKMVILIPFYLMSLQKELRRGRTPQNLERLKKLIFDDILGSITANYELGNITMDDAGRLKTLTMLLYRHLYAHYEEMEDLNDMTDESLILDYDIFLKKHNIESLDETVRLLEEMEISKKEMEISKKEMEISKKEMEISKKEMEIREKEIASGRQNLESNQKALADRQSSFIKNAIATFRRCNMSDDDIKKQISDGFELSDEEIEGYFR